MFLQNHVCSNPFRVCLHRRPWECCSISVKIFVILCKMRLWIISLNLVNSGFVEHLLCNDAWTFWALFLLQSLVNIKCKIVISYWDAILMYPHTAFNTQESLLIWQAKDKNEARSFMLAPFCIEMVIVMSMFRFILEVIWKGEVM